MREWHAAPAGLLEEMVEARAYARAKAMYDAATTTDAQERLPQSELLMLVKQIEFDIVREMREAHANG